jgi:hypothetical protein
MQSEEEEEPIQAKIMRQEEEEEVQTKIMRQEEEEEVQTKIMMQEEEEELVQGKSIRRGTEGEDELRSMGRPEISRLAVSKLDQTPSSDERTVSDSLTDRIMQSKGDGGPVPTKIQHNMEAHLGYDFSQVKVKTNSEAVDLCHQLGARAFTHGPDIWVGQGESIHDARLMSHELTHVAQQGAAPKMVAREESDLTTKAQSQLQRAPGTGMIQADGDEAEVTPDFPSISTITGDSRVKQARDEDWQAGKKDFLERFGWITWDSETKKCAVTGRKTGNEFGVSPDSPPSDAHPVYMVGHYHTHPPLSDKMKSDQKEYRKQTGKEMFPIGPSSADKGFANGKNSPGVVEDFITALRWPAFLTWDFKYGPTKRA